VIFQGTSKLLGIELMMNFSQPYFSTSISDFWRKWHISLSTWLRDYVYIPLGGNRNGESYTYRNLFLTMLVGGVWHGANWTFAFWGALHGTFLAISRWLKWDQFAMTSIPRQVACSLFTFHMVCFAWIFFRADTIGSAFEYISGILDGSSYFESKQQLWFSGRIAVLLLCLILLDVGQAVYRNEFFLLRLPTVVRGIVYGAIVAIILVFGGLDANIPFIYFQF